ncbi:MAG: dephospho-CoA kinase [Rhodospirillales bacterium]|nr:dephospho-CoA kinase [Rhodospirillales bacterium]
MIVLGLTGSIAMGKSTAAGMFRRLGVPVWDADGVVHALFDRGGAAVAPVEAAFPGVVRDGRIDREALGARVLGDPVALDRLEGIVHPLVYADQHRFLARQRRARRRLVLLDVPLLFESGGDRVCDKIAVVSAPALVQRQRLRQRLGMDEARIDAILARQMPDAEKRSRADFVIPTGLGRAWSMRAVARIVAALSSCGPGRGRGANARGRSRHRNHGH